MATKKANTKPKTTKVTAIKPKSKKAPAKEAPVRKSESSTSSFWSFKLTEQSAYWVIIMTLLLLIGIWTVRQEIEIQRIYDAIEETNRQTDDLTRPAGHTHSPEHR